MYKRLALVTIIMAAAIIMQPFHHSFVSAEDNPFIQLKGKLDKVVSSDKQMPKEYIIIQSEDGQFYFLLGRLVNRLRELLEKVKILKQKEVVLEGVVYTHATKIYKGKIYPVFMVSDYILPEIEGIDLAQEEIIKDSYR